MSIYYYPLSLPDFYRILHSLQIEWRKMFFFFYYLGIPKCDKWMILDLKKARILNMKSGQVCIQSAKRANTHPLIIEILACGERVFRRSAYMRSIISHENHSSEIVSVG